MAEAVIRCLAPLLLPHPRTWRENTGGLSVTPLAHHEDDCSINKLINNTKTTVFRHYNLLTVDARHNALTMLERKDLLLPSTYLLYSLPLRE